MSNDLPDFVSDEHPSTPEAAPAAPPETPAAAPAEAPAPAEPAPAPAAPPAPPEAHSVPLPTFLDMRDKLSAAEKRAKELEEWRQQQEAAARRQPAPNRDEDPDGYEQHRQAQIEHQLYELRLEHSKALAEVKHGEPTVKAAFDWGVARCDQDPFFNQKVRASKDPMAFVVSEWKRDLVASKVDPGELDAFLAWKAQQAGSAPAGHTAAAPAAPPQKPAAPRPSLAAGPSAAASAGAVPRDGEATFDAMFGS